MTTPKSIIVHGRHWFQKTSGNTYHTTQIFVDGKLIGTTPIEYGYGEQYLWTAFKWLEAKEYIQRRAPVGCTEPPWVYCERVGCTLEYFSTDVERKKDL